MSEYTKAPWLIARECSTFVYALGPKGTNLFWCKVDKAGPEKISDSEAKANARLIAESPAMAELIKEMLEHGESFSMHDKARAILARIKGEKNET